MKKLLTAIALVLCAAVLLTGCGTAPAAETDSAAGESKADVSKEEQSKTEESQVEAPAAEKVDMWVGNMPTGVEDWSTNPILMEIEKATGTDLSISWMDPASYGDQLNAAAASGAFPDIACCVWVNKTTLRTWVDGGILASFEAAVAEAAPNVISQYEENSFLGEIKMDGKIYLQPVYWGKENEPNAGLIHVRKDLMDKYGIKEIETYDQYVEYLKKAKDDGLQGVTFTAAQGFDGRYLNTMLGAHGKPYTGWCKNGENYEYWSVQPEVGDALVLWRNLIADGLVSPEVWTSDNDTARAEYVSGKAASLIFNGGGHIGRMQNDMALIDPSYKEVMLPALDFGSGTRGYTNEPMYSGYTAVGGGEQNHPVAAARVVDFLVSEEGEKLTAIGIEGRDYKQTGTEYDQVEWLDARFEDGFPTEANDAGAHPLASGIVSWQPMKWQEFTLLYGKDDTYKAWYEEQRANQVKYVVPAYGINSSCAAWDAFAATSEDLFKRAVVEAINAKSDEETKAIWDKFIADWNSQGGDAATVEMNTVLKEIN